MEKNNTVHSSIWDALNIKFLFLKPLSECDKVVFDKGHQQGGKKTKNKIKRQWKIIWIWYELFHSPDEKHLEKEVLTVYCILKDDD